MEQKNLSTKIAREYLHAAHQISVLDRRLDACWLRIPWVMVSNSLLPEQRSTEVQWFYDELRPDVNFVEVHSHVSDIAEKVMRLRDNDHAVLSIVRNANELARSS